MTHAQLLAQRTQLLHELNAITVMRRGSIIQQRVERTDAQGRKVRRGPYPLYTYKEGGKTVSRRLTQPEEMERYRHEIDQFRRFEVLTAELRRIGEQLCETVQAEAQDEAVKKKSRKSPSRGTRK